MAFDERERIILYRDIQFLIAALGVGVAGGSFAVGIAYVSRWYSAEKQGTALGIFGAGNVGAAVTKCGASYSWYLYSGNRVKYPLVRSRLLKLWREARALRTPVAAWKSIVEDAGKRASYVSKRGTRSGWAMTLC